jgi:hypothetical protein
VVVPLAAAGEADPQSEKRNPTDATPHESNNPG